MLSSEQKKKLHTLYLKGTLTHYQIAAQLHLDYGQVYNFFKKNYHIFYYVKPRRNPRTRRNYEEPLLMKNIKEAYAKYIGGWTLEKVGKEYGRITKERVRQVFKLYGLKSRPQGKERKLKTCAKCSYQGFWRSGKNCPTCTEELKKKRAKGLHLKTHCINGHLLIGNNLLKTLDKKGLQGRRCKTCAYTAAKKWRSKI